MINRQSGLSMVEIMVAVMLIALATGPLIGVLSSSSKMSNASIYEEMAVHYAREISDQLLRMSSQFADIVGDARASTGDSSITLASILNDSDFMAKLEEHSLLPEAIPLQVNGTKLPMRLIVSPLDNAFTKRRMAATRLDTTANSVLNGGLFWKIRIDLAWKDKNSGRDEPREIVVVFIAKEG